MATKKAPPIIAMSAPVAIEAAQVDGEKKGPAKFTSTFYTGGALDINGWDLPVVVDLAGLEEGKVLVANLDHDSKQRVGNFAVANDGHSLVANGTATAATAARDEVVNSAANGYQWQASLEVNPKKVEEVKAGKEVEVNGQKFTGPLYVTRKGVLKGFAFVSHGADDNTSATIAAIAASSKEKVMDTKIAAWATSMGIDVENASAEQIAVIEANYAGQNGKPAKKIEASNPFEERKLEAKRRKEISDIAEQWAEKREGDYEYVVAIEKLKDHAIEAKMSVTDFRAEMYETVGLTAGQPIRSPNKPSVIPEKVIEAALAKAGRLSTLEKVFDEQTLEATDKHFRDGITLSELFYICAEANGYKGRRSGRITQEVQDAAFGKLPNGQRIHAQGWSTISISNVLSNNQNKFLRDGWMSVDRTALDVASIRSVTDFREITTVSLTGGLKFEQVGPAGEIKHGTVGDMTYTNKADTYAIMLAITRQDMINDDLGALTALPRRIGRGGALKLNEIFWTEFLNNSAFFTAGNNNVNTGVADMTSGGLAATETIFLNQTDPDGYPLASMPTILLVPTALKGAADSLMSSDRMLGTTGPDGNIWRGRFRVLSSPYMSNSSFTGYSAAAWYMLASPSDLPVIEIVALNGRVEPTVDSADTDFNTLGVQFRGYSDVGVNLQEYRGGVRADGGAS